MLLRLFVISVDKNALPGKSDLKEKAANESSLQHQSYKKKAIASKY